jgi:hypothetical protein
LRQIGIDVVARALVEEDGNINAAVKKLDDPPAICGV